MRYSWICLMVFLACAGISSARDEATSENNRRLQRLFEQFPEADENGDGVLTVREARRYRALLRALDEHLDVSDADLDPEYEAVSYGPHPRQVMDLWLAAETDRAPLVIYVHGGGFISGDKRAVRGLDMLPRLLERGVSVASINYRLLNDAPLYQVLRDGARAVQFARAQAETYRIDPARVAIVGSSAGAGIALWTAFRDDVADPAAADPVRRQSSRVTCAGAINPQASYDPRDWAWIMGPPPGGSLDGAKRYYIDTDAVGDPEQRERLLQDVSIVNHITADDPPVFLMNRYPDGFPATDSHYKHHPNHIRVLAERCEAEGVPYEAALLSDGVSGRLAEARLFMFILKNLGVPLTDDLRPASIGN